MPYVLNPLSGELDYYADLDADLAAIAALTGTGIPARTADDTWALRTLTAPAAGITITNPAGVAGNPTLVLADDLAALEALSSTGIARRTGTSTWTVGTTVAVAEGGTGITSGTSGGVLGFTAAGTLASSVLLTASALVLGGGAGATPTPMASLGTTTTVLHGNAAGAPTFGAVSLTADVSGDLPFANLAQIAGVSVLGVAGASTADVAAITGTGGQVLRLNGLGTSLGFGAIALGNSAAVAGTLLAVNGGTGFASYAVGDVLYADTTTTLAKLADVATGNALISGGVGVAPSWGKIGLTTHVTGVLPAANLPGSFNGFATPTASAGLTAIAGSAATAMRSDGAPALSVAIVPVWTGIHSFQGGAIRVGDPTPTTGNPVIYFDQGGTGFIGNMKPAALSTNRSWTIQNATGYIQVHTAPAAPGSIVFGGSSDAVPMTELAIGSNGAVLTIVAGVPAWTAATVATTSPIFPGGTRVENELLIGTATNYASIHALTVDALAGPEIYNLPAGGGTIVTNTDLPGYLTAYALLTDITTTPQTISAAHVFTGTPEFRADQDSGTSLMSFKDTFTSKVCQFVFGATAPGADWQLAIPTSSGTLAVASSTTSGRIAFWTSGSLLTTDADLSFLTDTLTTTKLKIGTSLTSVGGTAPVADGTYTVGDRITPVTGNLGTITTKSGIITAIQQAT